MASKAIVPQFGYDDPQPGINKQTINPVYNRHFFQSIVVNICQSICESFLSNVQCHNASFRVDSRSPEPIIYNSRSKP